MKVRTRIAPSPTGFAHVGTAWMAIFNMAFARKNNGEFILRLEDTDRKRNVSEAEGFIYEGLSWLNINWDEGPDKGGSYGPYRQSERLSIYKEWLSKLEAKGLVFPDDGAIRFKNTLKSASWNDMVRREITFPGEEITDFVIFKSDGFPTFNYANVIDDITMETTHVIRGEEHISNTPRQIALYEAFGKEPPIFAHLPTLRNEQRKKLSKRRDPVDLRLFRQDGVLPEALVNFLCLMGWSHPEGKEIFSMDEFIAKFDFDRVGKTGPIFDREKLMWINGEYIRLMSDNELVERLFSFYEEKYDRAKLAQIIFLIKTRIKTLKEFESLAGFFFGEPKVDKKLLGKKSKEHLEASLNALKGVDDWRKEKLDEALMEELNRNSFKTGEFFMDLRIAITGSRVTPPINESLVILGKETSIQRIKNALG